MLFHKAAYLRLDLFRTRMVTPAIPANATTATQMMITIRRVVMLLPPSFLP
jgi:hypothetical protein